MKICTVCKIEKSIENFAFRSRVDVNGNKYQKHLSSCKLCNSEKSKQRYYEMKKHGTKFVYRLIDDDNKIVYVGKTESLPTRTNQHFSKLGKFKNQNLRIEYLAMDSTALMQIREIYYINLYKPKYNTIFMNNEPTIYISDFDKDVWLSYSIGGNIETQNRLDIFNEFLKINSIFKRKRGDKYFVYVEVTDRQGNKKQISKGSFTSEIRANELVEKLKQYNL